MAKPNQQESLRWRHRILAAEEYQKRCLADSDEAVSFYQSRNHWFAGWMDQYRVLPRFASTANLVWGNLQSLIPAIYGGVPRVLVKARGAEYAAAAKSQEKYFRWLMSQIDWVRRRRKVVRTAMLRGYGVMKVVYKDGPKSSAVEPRTGEEAMPPGNTYAFRLDPYEFICDPDAALDLSKARWVAHKIRRTPEDLRRDKAYAHTDEIEGGTENPWFRDYRKTASGIDTADFKDQQRTEIYEVWVRDYAGMERQKLVISPQVVEPLAYGPWPYSEIETFPFDVLAFEEGEEIEDGTPARPIPKTQAWIPLQIHLNVLVSKLLAGVETYDRIVALDSGKLSSRQEKEKIVVGGDMTVIDVNTMDVRSVAAPLIFGQMPPELWGALDRLLLLYDRVSGVTDLLRGMAPASMSATGGAIQQGNIALGPKDMRTKIAESDRNILRLMKQVSQEFLPEEFLFQVSGPSGDEWVRATQEEIRAELDVEIDVDSLDPETLAQRRQRNMQALQLVGPILNSPNGVTSGLRELIKRNLEDIGFDDAELFLPPVQGQSAEEEHVRWLLNEPPLPEVRPEDDDASHIAKHQAFRDRYEARLQAMEYIGEAGPVSGLQVVEDHIARHDQQMAVKRASGGLSVRGSLRPMATAEGTPGGMTGSPGAQAPGSLYAPPNLPA